MTSAPRGTGRLVARTRGQVMVLGCVALLITALMLMTSFNISNAIHERIRIQSHSDAAAYSLATIEARAFNVTAHFNRAIAAALVAQMSLHSWMAIMTNDVAMLNAGFAALMLIAAAETALGCYPFNFAHCPHVISAIISAFRMMRKAREFGQKLQGLESKFNDAVADLQKMVESLHSRQKTILQTAQGEITGVGSVLSALKQTNAKNSDYVMALSGENNTNFQCAQEGGVDSGGGGCSGRSRASATERSKIIQNTANATRPLFDKGGSTAINHQNFRNPYDPDVPKGALTTGHFMHEFLTQARVGEGTGTNSSNTAQAKNVGAGNQFGVGLIQILNFHCIPVMPMAFNGKIFSEESGGSHTLMPPFPGRAHSGQHNQFKGVQMQDTCNGNGSCFVNFRSTSSANDDYGMPTVYAGVTQSLRIFQGKNGDFGTKAPWEVNDQGEINVELVSGKPAKLKLVPRGDAVAVSKAKVYFHQQGNWKVAPNFFDPFWRSKLHFFSKQELQKVVGMAGDSNGAQFLGSGAPAEGED